MSSAGLSMRAMDSTRADDLPSCWQASRAFWRSGVFLGESRSRSTEQELSWSRAHIVFFDIIWEDTYGRTHLTWGQGSPVHESQLLCLIC